MSDNKTAEDQDVESVIDDQTLTADDVQVEDTLEAAEETISEDITILLAESQAESVKHKDMALRIQADMENLRRRTRMDIASAHKFALNKFVDALIPGIDSMEMGLEAASKEDATIESIRDGIDMTFKQILGVLGEFNVDRIDPKGDKFDPKLHEALSMVPSPEYESNTVIDVIQKGYILNDRLIRPARVIVAK